jgi:hypothetical protein
MTASRSRSMHEASIRPGLSGSVDVAHSDAFGVAEPRRDAGGAGDRCVSDAFALLLQSGECHQDALEFVEAVTAAGLGKGVRVAPGIHAGSVQVGPRL